jgi:hypothetical protein
MLRLQTAVGKILVTQYAARADDTIAADRTAIAAELDSWEDCLPPEMGYGGLGEGMGKGFWANMLHMAYKFVASSSRVFFGAAKDRRLIDL